MKPGKMKTKAKICCIVKIAWNAPYVAALHEEGDWRAAMMVMADLNVLVAKYAAGYAHIFAAIHKLVGAAAVRQSGS